jgi:hypothetical protein
MTLHKCESIRESLRGSWHKISRSGADADDQRYNQARFGFEWRITLSRDTEDSNGRSADIDATAVA